jgi:hypothetical protein
MSTNAGDAGSSLPFTNENAVRPGLTVSGPSWTQLEPSNVNVTVGAAASVVGSDTGLGADVDIGAEVGGGVEVELDSTSLLPHELDTIKATTATTPARRTSNTSAIDRIP